MTEPETREIECFRCRSDQTWGTDFIDIPTRVPLKDNGAVQAATETAARAIDWKDESPVFVGLHHSNEEQEDRHEQLAECPPRASAGRR